MAAASTSAHDELLHTRRRMVDDLLAELREQARVAGDSREVVLIETHISWVLLGREVYKIKKPITLPFLDFSQFEARERACRTEVQINRRLAPRVYLGVVPIRKRSDGRYSFCAGGPVVEWAVRMKRLDESRRADHLLAAGRLDAARVDVIAAALAAFHADCPASVRIAHYGLPEAIERNVRENFSSLRGTRVDLIPAGAMDEIERWQFAFLRGRADVFESRMRAGFVRDGHGDLRLEHVFLNEVGDDLEVIDGIEFDERYRYGDVCADIAFLAMDLARFGHVDLAERFIATYARATNDFDLYSALDFYESYRACVRAKISASGAAARWAPEPIRRSAAADARRYLLLAQSARRRPIIPPVLISVAGGIATGKSTLAERLALELSAPIVDADRTRKFMLGRPPTKHLPAEAWQGAYDPAFTRRVYDEVLRRAGVVLASGRPVIIDASFRAAESRMAARALASTYNVPLRVLECVAPMDICRERLAQRAAFASVSDARPELLDAFTAGFEPIVELPEPEHLKVDTSGSGGDPVEQARRAIDTWPRGLVS
jgi:aminoglycoside phosphotransferase family enzyme/predicted kinase